MARSNTKTHTKTIDTYHIAGNVIRKIKNENLLNMAAQYMTALIESGYGMKKHGLLSLNMIDMRPVMRPTTHKYDMPAANNAFKTRYEILNRPQSERNFFEIVPCFSEGVCQINDDRYIHWNIKNIDATNQTMAIQIMTYAEYTGVWCPETSLTFFVEFDKTQNKLKVCAADGDVLLHGHLSAVYGMYDEHMLAALGKKFPEVYAYAKPLNLNWTEKQKAIWSEQIIKPACKITKQQCDANTHNGIIVFHIFIDCMTLLNQYLRTDKPKTTQKNSTEARQYTPKSQIEIAADAIQSDRIIRLVGDIPVHSTEIPKPPTPATVINYKTPAWTTRGHFRHYKSGKVVYIKETVRRRRCMQSSMAKKSVPQTIVKFKETEMTLV